MNQTDTEMTLSEHLSWKIHKILIDGPMKRIDVAKNIGMKRLTESDMKLLAPIFWEEGEYIGICEDIDPIKKIIELKNSIRKKRGYSDRAKKINA